MAHKIATFLWLKYFFELIFRIWRVHKTSWKNFFVSTVIIWCLQTDENYESTEVICESLQLPPTLSTSKRVRETQHFFCLVFFFALNIFYLSLWVFFHLRIVYLCVPKYDIFLSVQMNKTYSKCERFIWIKHISLWPKLIIFAFSLWHFSSVKKEEKIESSDCCTVLFILPFVWIERFTYLQREYVLLVQMCRFSFNTFSSKAFENDRPI